MIRCGCIAALIAVERIPLMNERLIYEDRYRAARAEKTKWWKKKIIIG